LKYALWFVVLAWVHLSALELSVNSGKEKSGEYSLLHIMHSEPFGCQKKLNLDDSVAYIYCTFDTPPTNRITSTQTDFFAISSKGELGKFYIIVKPKKKIRLISIENRLIDDQLIYDIQNPTSNHWLMLGYQSETPPIIRPDRHKEGIRFPIAANDTIIPSVGALNFNQEPISYDTEQDVEDFLKVKKAYQAGKYDDLVGDIEEYISTHKESLFASDFQLYKLRTLDKIGGESEADDIIELATKWLVEFPSNESIAEVMRILAKAYTVKSQYDQAKKYFELIVTEHANTLSSQWAMIDYGDLKLKTRDGDGAIKMYEKALYTTKDIELASVAAMKLAQRSEQRNQNSEAQKYYQKILNGNKEYFTNDPIKSWGIAKKMAKNEAYLLAADIAQILLEDNSEEIEDTKERMLVSMASWYYEANESDKAIANYQKYLKEYAEEGEFLDRVQSEYDKVMFETADDSDEERYKRYDELMEKYSGQPIANKATYAKAKLLFENKNYSGLLMMQSDIEFLSDEIAPDKSELINLSAKALGEELLSLVQEDNYQEGSRNKKLCRELEEFHAGYQFDADIKYDKAQYICYMTLGENDKAINLAKEYYSSDNIDERLEWMLRAQKVLKRQNSLKKLTKLTEDIIETANIHDKVGYDELMYDIFDAKVIQNIPQDKLIEYADKVLDRFPEHKKNLEVYKELIKVAVTNKDQLLSIAYSKKLIDLQSALGSKRYTPWVEFVYLQALMDSDKLKRAKSFSKELMSAGLLGEDRLKLLYLRSNVLMRTGWPSRAKPLLQECSDSLVKSKWVGLCQESLKWVDEE
jgi:tetratricopeptide (TPR) repeat protein